MGYETCHQCNESCKYFHQPPKPKLRDVQDHGGYTDEHHLMYPKGAYKDPLEMRYRELEENKVQLCRAEHDKIHIKESPPKKPNRSIMIQAIAEDAIRRSLEG